MTGEAGKKHFSILLASFLVFQSCPQLFSSDLLRWDFPDEKPSIRKEREILNKRPDARDGALQEGALSQGTGQTMPLQFPSEDFDPSLEPGMILVLESFDPETMHLVARSALPILSDEILSIPGAGVFQIVGKKLSEAGEIIKKKLGKNFRIGIMMGTVQTVQVLGKVQRPGNYQGYMKLSYLLAEAMDRAPGSNFKISFFNGAERKLSLIRYEEVVKGIDNPLVPPGSIVYLPPSAGALFGEMTEKQVNLAYILVITLGALGITAIARQ